MLGTTILCVLVGFCVAAYAQQNIAVTSDGNDTARTVLPGAKVRITTKGLQYVNLVASRLLTVELRKASIPDFDVAIDKGPGKGRVQTKNARVQNFESPNFYHTLRPADNSVTWGSSGGQATVVGNWSARYETMLTIKGNGVFSIKAEDIQMEITGQLGSTAQGLPQIVASQQSCIARIGTLNVHVEGGFLGWIINQFRTELENLMRAELMRQFCYEMIQMVNVYGNYRLATMNKKVPLQPNLMLDYSLTQSPIVAAQYVESQHKGEVLFAPSTSTPFEPAQMPSDVQNDRMLYFWGSDYIVRSLLFALHNNSQLQVLATKHSSKELAPLLSTVCEGMCVGAAFAQLGEHFPNKSVSLHISTIDVPEFTIRPDRVTTNADLKVQIFFDEAELGLGERKDLLTLNIKLGAAIALRIIDSRIAGNMSIYRFSIRSTDSKVGAVSDFDLSMMTYFLQPQIEKFVNARLMHGLPIPTLLGVQLVSPRLRLLTNTVIVESDVSYMTI